jgi:hypothetical protein
MILALSLGELLTLMYYIMAEAQCTQHIACYVGASEPLL